MDKIDPIQQHATVIADMHHRGEQAAGTHQRFMERATAALARPRTVYVTLAACVSWLVLNGTAGRWGCSPIDPPPFAWLQGAVGLSALFISTLVLITQNRQAHLNERRGQVDLHVNLSAEQKIAKLIQLIEELRRDLPSVRNRTDPQAEQMQHPADPHDVLAVLEDTLADPRSPSDAALTRTRL